ncbi:serine/threonine-protein kinase [Methanoculleus oceani]|uniref:Serine/threonine protein kinase n=1 Tax=Methanoculleus oceani TaxID=2184756 RepID=A0ABD4TFJ3_9EURY|nr:serine/threonine-protein kinase [Methanoculleus sp. CWC-02]MCM2466273.1 serine/threonine protein kinase [Methanoculleus sp. CWC-02]
MPPERAGRAAVLLLISALLLAAVCPAVSGAGGPPEHSSASPQGIESAVKTPTEDKSTAPGQNRGRDTPEETPTPQPSPEETVTPADTPGEERTEATAEATATGTAGETPTENSRTVTDPFPWTGVVLALVLLAGAFVLGARYLKRPGGADTTGTSPGTTILPGAYRTVLSHPPGFPPELAERYGQVAFVGRGGLGQVFSAVRRDDRRTVAVKIPVAYDEATGKTFMKEMRFWEDLTHENIVAVHSVNILPVPYVEMEYLPRTLEQLEKPLPVETAARIAAGIAAGLAYAHGRGVIHRDIKPRNILLADDLTPKITDWGMSTTLAASRDTTIAGFTLAYAAPEQIAPERFGRTDARTDIYQLGAVFYELVTGKTPNAGESLAGFAEATLDEQPVPPGEINPDAAGFDPIILRCLAKDPADRYRSAGEVLDAIETAMGDAGDERA